jgi:hypothetical protein
VARETGHWWPVVGDFATAVRLRVVFSRCISTPSCGTDYSISVSNGLVCFANLTQSLTSTPVYFTLLESCADSRCIMRSIVTVFNIVTGECVCMPFLIALQQHVNKMEHQSAWAEGRFSPTGHSTYRPFNCYWGAS